MRFTSYSYSWIKVGRMSSVTFNRAESESVVWGYARIRDRVACKLAHMYVFFSGCKRKKDNIQPQMFFDAILTRLGGLSLCSLPQRMPRLRCGEDYHVLRKNSQLIVLYRVVHARQSMTLRGQIAGQYLPWFAVPVYR